MVAQLMGEDTGEFLIAEFVDGESGDDDQMSAAGEGVELVGGQDAYDEVAR